MINEQPKPIAQAGQSNRLTAKSDHESGAPHAVRLDKALYEEHLLLDKIVGLASATPHERFEAFALSVREFLAKRWVDTESTYEREDPKRVYYLSMEFLIGRSLANNIANLLLDADARRAVEEIDLDWIATLEQEADAGLGSGGLGRLAACFLDSLATLQIPAMGYGLRYEYGMFKQVLLDGWQIERPDNWLARHDPWEIRRVRDQVEIHLGCSFEVREGTLQAITGKPSRLIGVPFDRPTVGYGGNTITTLRLWAAKAPDYFDFQAFSHGEFVDAVAEALEAESLTRVLYPDDSTSLGQGLRFVQEYFLVACSLADVIRRFRLHNTDWSLLPEKAALQLNDTHPSFAVPELMRILLDEAHLDWDTAWNLSCRTLGYTNHTLLPEALEKWPLPWFQLLVPRQLEIILEINRRLLEAVRNRYPGDEGRVQRVSLIEEGAIQHVRMANLAIVGAHSTNGVAKIHSELLRTTTVKDLAEMFPERFSNKTNGVTPRRWLLLSNPALADLITEAIGSAWITDLEQLTRLQPLASDPAFLDKFMQVKRRNKILCAQWIGKNFGFSVDPETIFDCHVKRIHEYKRQLLNALRIIVLYNRLRADPQSLHTPRTFIFAGKAAAAYYIAKLIIKFIESVARTIAADPAANARLRVIFLPDYDVSMAQRLIPASDVSNQISTAGYEASGTSNMKFMMNGALTLGTRDGATIEMAAAAGEENFLLFGLTAQQIRGSRGWYNPRWHYDHDPETRAALDLIASGHFSGSDPNFFQPLYELLMHEDRYMHLADLRPYLEADRQMRDWYADPRKWARKAILNVACSGRFSSDRTIGEYAKDIWGVKACPVSSRQFAHE